MRTAVVFFILAAITIAPLTGPVTATVSDIGSQSSQEELIRPISDQAAKSIQGALARKWTCAIGAFSLGVGLLSAAPMSGGVTAIFAPAAFNAAAFCLI